MKMLVMKKTTVFIVLCLLVFACSFAVNPVLAVGATYFETARKVPIYSVETESNKVAISFDAAWGADKTRTIMDICDSYNVKATFFLVGFWIEKYPEMVKEIYNRGFEIGIHSNTHPDMTKLSRKQIKSELLTNIELIKNLVNYTPKVFRPPFGYYNNTLIDVCDELNLKCIEWSVDSLDWKGLSASALAGRVNSKVKNGSIVLFHNNSDHIEQGLKMVLEGFKQKSLLAVPVGELIYFDNYKIDANGTQIKN